MIEAFSTSVLLRSILVVLSLQLVAGRGVEPVEHGDWVHCLWSLWSEG